MRAILSCLLLASVLLLQGQTSSELIARADTTSFQVERVRIWCNLLGMRLPYGQVLTSKQSFQALLADTLNDDPWAWMLRAAQLEREGRLGEAQLKLERCEELFDKEQNEHGLALTMLDQAAILSRNGNQSVSTKKYFDALHIIEKQGTVWDELHALGGLAYIFRYQREFESAMDYYRREGELAKNIGDHVHQIGALRGAGGILMEQGNVEKAEAKYREALQLSEIEALPRMQAVLQVELANVQVARQKFAEAKKEMLAALPIFQGQGAITWASYLQARLAEVLLELGEKQEALQMAENGLALAQKHGLRKEELDNLTVLPNICADLGLWKQALEYSLSYESARDSLRNDAISTELARLDVRQQQVRDSLLRMEQLEKERYEFEANVAKAEGQRNLFLLIGLGVLLLVAGLWSRLRHIRKTGRELAYGNERIAEEKLRAERSEMVKDQFLANMSHEIRTPMNAIMGMTASLRRGDKLPGQDRYLDAIAQSSSNLLVILNDILDLGKLEEGKMDLEEVPMDLRKVIGNVVDILRFKAEEKGLWLKTEIASEVPQLLFGDPTRLNQVLVNLVGNGIKFTEKGGVTIKVEVLAKGDKWRFVFRVVDTGIGISEDRIEKIFEEFTQAYSDTTRKYGGTGLGLTITQRLVELQGGRIDVQSARDQGSTFNVEIPYALAPEGTEATDPFQADPSILLTGLRVLLAEDNEFNVMVATDELNDMITDLHLDVAENGAIALQKAKEEEYDLVLMDIQMPEMNGFEAAKAIRALPGKAGRVPIIAMTANVLESEVKRSKEVGMNGFVPKPFEREDLLSQLTAAIVSSRSSS